MLEKEFKAIPQLKLKYNLFNKNWYGFKTLESISIMFFFILYFT